jgi:hypothetical protein
MMSIGFKNTAFIISLCGGLAGTDTCLDDVLPVKGWIIMLMSCSSSGGMMMDCMGLLAAECKPENGKPCAEFVERCRSELLCFQHIIDG